MNSFDRFSISFLNTKWRQRGQQQKAKVTSYTAHTVLPAGIKCRSNTHKDSRGSRRRRHNEPTVCTRQSVS